MAVVKKSPVMPAPQPQAQDVPDLTEQEVTFMLQHFSSCTFDGRDVLLLASVVAKLQGMLQEG